MSTTQQMHKRLEAALELEEAGSKELGRWLRNLDLPPRSGDEEPYVWVLRGLSDMDEQAVAERTLALWVARFLDELSEVKGSTEDHYVYNLLRLSARLASPKQLWKPLLKLYNRRSLQGSYDEVKHEHSLLEALAQNQADSQLRDVWLSMACGEPDEYFRGTPEDGLWALRLTPDPQRGRGYPDLEAMCLGLNYQVHALEDSPDRRRSLYEYCWQWASTYENVAGHILERLVDCAEVSRWPGWAVTALPSLFFRSPTHHSCLYVWNIYSTSLRRLCPVVEFVRESYCDGRISLVSVDEVQLREVTSLMNMLEERRIGSPIRSERGVIGDINQLLMEMEHAGLIPDASLEKSREEFLKNDLQVVSRV